MKVILAITVASGLAVTTLGQSCDTIRDLKKQSRCKLFQPLLSSLDYNSWSNCTEMAFKDPCNPTGGICDQVIETKCVNSAIESITILGGATQVGAAIVDTQAFKDAVLGLLEEADTDVVAATATFNFEALQNIGLPAACIPSCAGERCVFSSDVITSIDASLINSTAYLGSGGQFSKGFDTCEQEIAYFMPCADSSTQASCIAIRTFLSSINFAQWPSDCKPPTTNFEDPCSVSVPGCLYVTCDGNDAIQDVSFDLKLDGITVPDDTFKAALSAIAGSGVSITSDFVINFEQMNSFPTSFVGQCFPECDGACIFSPNLVEAFLGRDAAAPLLNDLEQFEVNYAACAPFLPTSSPTLNPTQAPSQTPTQAPSQSPTKAPTKAPTREGETLSPTGMPTPNPTKAPVGGDGSQTTNSPTPSTTTTSAPTKPLDRATQGPTSSSSVIQASTLLCGAAAVFVALFL